MSYRACFRSKKEVPVTIKGLSYLLTSKKRTYGNDYFILSVVELPMIIQHLAGGESGLPRWVLEAEINNQV